MDSNLTVVSLKDGKRAKGKILGRVGWAQFDRLCSCHDFVMRLFVSGGTVFQM
jgi:hypothetical protein